MSLFKSSEVIVLNLQSLWILETTEPQRPIFLSWEHPQAGTGSHGHTILKFFSILIVWWQFFKTIVIRFISLYSCPCLLSQTSWKRLPWEMFFLLLTFLLTSYFLWLVLAMVDLWPQFSYRSPAFPLITIPNLSATSQFCDSSIDSTSAGCPGANLLWCRTYHFSGLSFLLQSSQTTILLRLPHPLNIRTMFQSWNWDKSHILTRTTGLCAYLLNINAHTSTLKVDSELMDFFLYTFELVEALVEHPSPAFHHSSL